MDCVNITTNMHTIPSTLASNATPLPASWCSKAAKAAKTGSSPLLRLPMELRIQIYRYSGTASTLMYVKRFTEGENKLDWTLTPRERVRSAPPPSLMLVNKTIYEEYKTEIKNVHTRLCIINIGQIPRPERFAESKQLKVDRVEFILESGVDGGDSLTLQETATHNPDQNGDNASAESLAGLKRQLADANAHLDFLEGVQHIRYFVEDQNCKISRNTFAISRIAIHSIKRDLLARQTPLLNTVCYTVGNCTRDIKGSELTLSSDRSMFVEESVNSHPRPYCEEVDDMEIRRRALTAYAWSRMVEKSEELLGCEFQASEVN